LPAWLTARQENPVLTSQVVIETAARLGIMAAEGVTLDEEALRQLDAVAPWPDDPSRAV
jgi:hypothetical protein